MKDRLLAVIPIAIAIAIFIMAGVIAFGLNNTVGYAIATVMFIINVGGIVLWLDPHVGDPDPDLIVMSSRDRCRFCDGQGRRFKGKMY